MTDMALESPRLPARPGRGRRFFRWLATDFRAALAILVLQVLSGTLAMSGMFFAFRSSAREADGRSAALKSADTSREQVARLFEMADVLQSAADYGDANQVLKATASELLPGFSGALYVFNNSRDRLVLSTSWGRLDDEPPQVVTLVPQGYQAQNRNPAWEKSVGDNAHYGKSRHVIAAAGYHTLKVWMIDPAVVMQKLVVDLGGLKPYLLRHQHDLAGQGAGLADRVALLQLVRFRRFAQGQHTVDPRLQPALGQPAIDVVGRGTLRSAGRRFSWRAAMAAARGRSRTTTPRRCRRSI